MLKYLTNMSIFRRLFLAATLSAIIPGIVIFVLGSSYIGTLATINETVRTSNDAVKLATDMQADLLRMNALLSAQGTGSTNSASANIQISREIRDLTNDFGQKLSTYQKNYQISTSDNMKSVRDVLNSNGEGGQAPISQRSMIFVVNLQWQEYARTQDQVLLDLKKPKQADLTNHLAQSNLLYVPLKGNLDNLVGLTESISQLVAQVNAAQINPIILGTVIAFLVSTLVVFLIGYIVNLTITNPLRRLAQLTRRIASGETNTRAPLSGHDEINTVAASMNNMLDSIVFLMREAQYQRDILQSQVEQMIREVSGIGEGDLGIQAQVTDNALGVLAHSFNFMLQELGNLVVRVKMVAYEVEKLTATSLERMTQLVEMGDHQLIRIKGAASEVEHMSGLTRQVTERARVLYAIATETRETAETGRVAVQQALAGMGHIHVNVQSTAEKVKLLGDNSREINDIVEVLSNVAYQTHRLALDAAVQAAMAGENGKGFAAVASDIRRLSEQTKNQTGMITRIVRTVNENIENAAVSMHETERETSEGTKLAQQARSALESIFSAVESQGKEIESINAMATQQLHSSGSVVKIMQSLSTTTEESSDSTRAASQNMWRLSRLVEQLRASVEVFKLREDQKHYIAESRQRIAEPQQQQRIAETQSQQRTGEPRTRISETLSSGNGELRPRSTRLHKI